MRRIHTAARVLLLVTVAAAGSAGAQDTTRGVRIGLEYRPGSQPGIVVLPVRGSDGDSIRAIFRRNFENGDRIRVISLDDSPDAQRPAAAPNYALYSRLGVAGIVQATQTPAGVHVALHDVASGRVIEVEDFPIRAAALGRDWRWAVHGVSDEIEQWITGTRGIAQTRIAFVRGGSLWVVDSDGAGETSIPTVSSPLSPAWSPTGSLLAYNTYGVDSRVLVHDFSTGRARVVSTTRGGVNQSAAFAPDGGTLAYAHACEDCDGSDLYQVAVDGRSSARRLTFGRGSINVSPTFRPDGRRLAYTSSRAGSPQVYIMDADGTNQELLTTFVFGEQSYQSNPDWSPDGRLVAYQSQIAGRFQVKTINLGDRTSRQWTSDGVNEDPSWAPDGRHLVFTSTRTGTRQLWILDTETGRSRQLTRLAGARSPAWSRRVAGVR
jgi:TolB protein